MKVHLVLKKKNYNAKVGGSKCAICWVCWIVQSDGGGVESACVAWGVSGKGKKTCVCFQRGI